MNYRATKFAATSHAAIPALPRQHVDDIAVEKLSGAMKARMAEKRSQGYSGWDDPRLCSLELLAGLMAESMCKGKLVDVADFAAMLFSRDAPAELVAEHAMRALLRGSREDQSHSIIQLRRLLTEARDTIIQCTTVADPVAAQSFIDHINAAPLAAPAAEAKQADATCNGMPAYEGPLSKAQQAEQPAEEARGVEDTDPTTKEQYRSMFHAACSDLRLINEKLGLDPDDGGADPILAAIDALLAAPAAAETVTGDGSGQALPEFSTHERTAPAAAEAQQQAPAKYKALWRQCSDGKRAHHAAAVAAGFDGIGDAIATAAHSRQPQDGALTEERIGKLIEQHDPCGQSQRTYEFARAIESAILARASESRAEGREAVTAKMVEAALSGAWNDFVSDTGCYPSCFTVQRGKRIEANFANAEGAFIDYIVGALNAALAASESRAEAEQTEALDGTAFSDGIEAAAAWVDDRREQFDDEFGARDPDTGAFEFRSASQEEYSGELTEIAEGIRALAAQMGDA